MRKTFRTIILLTVSLLTLLSAEALALAEDDKSIQGRMELEAHEEYLKVRVFLANKTDREITIETGRGRCP